MTKNKRRKIFYVLVAAFLIVGAATALYANGWRFDAVTFKISKVGAIFVRSFPADATITLNGQTIPNQSGFFGKGTLINDLLPRNYKVRLTAVGYLPWEENALVAPSLVNEFSDAVLVPARSIVVATSSPKNIWIVGDKVILQDEKNVLRVAGEKIGGGMVIEWTSNNQTILAKNGGTYALVNLEDGTVISLASLTQKTGIALGNLSLVLDPADGTRVYATDGKKLMMLDTTSNQAIKVYASSDGTMANVAISQFLIAWTLKNERTNTSTIVIFDKFLEKILMQSPALSGAPVALRWASNEKLMMLEPNGLLYLYDTRSGSIKKVAAGVKKFVLSGSGSRVAAIEEHSLEIFSLENADEYERLNLASGGAIVGVEWFRDESHLFLLYKTRIAFLDLKDTSLINLVNIAGTYEKEAYDGSGNQFYVLKNGAVERFDFAK